MRRAQYSIQKVDKDKKIVYIVDLDGPLSVTNDAEYVVRTLDNMYHNFRIIYQDTMGNWDELKHDNGVFTGFAPARNMSP